MTQSEKIAELLDKITAFEQNFKSTVQRIAETTAEDEEKEQLFKDLESETAAITKELTSIVSDLLNT